LSRERARSLRKTAGVAWHAVTVPTIVFYFDDDGQFVGTEHGIAPVAHAACRLPRVITARVCRSRVK
jgi:hypothetical protein